MSTKISIIIPCYNYGKYIEQCLMSVILQKRNFNIEVLVGDDNSSDSSFEIAKRIKSYYESDDLKFKLYKHPNNLGEIDNTKFLLENCEGDYVAYLDADDYWTDPNKLNQQVNFLDNNPEYSICITGYLELKNGVDYIPTSNFSSWLRPVNLDNLNSESLVYGNCLGSSSSRLFRNYKDLFKDYFYEFPYSDWVLNFELSFKGKLGYLNFPSYVYRIHNNSLSKKDSQNSQDLYNKRVGILRSMLEMYKSQNDETLSSF